MSVNTQALLSDMRAKKALLLLVSLLMVLSRISFVADVDGEPQERAVGVHVGDWAKYGNFLASWISNDPFAQIPPFGLIEHNNTEWVTNTVKTISDAIITFEAVTHYKNGTETSSYFDIDVNSGDGNGLFVFVSANLDPFESVYNSTVFFDTWINETIPLVYAESLRYSNILNSTTFDYVIGEIEQDLAYGIEYFWDRTTGILLERAGSFVNITGSYNTASVRSEVLIETNIWQPNPDTTPPTARAGPDQTVTIDQVVNFDAGTSSDNRGGWGIATYKWDFGDGTQESGITTSHAFQKTGNYTVTLTVEDWGKNSDTDTLVVNVQEAAPPPPSDPFPLGFAILILGVSVFVVAGLFLWKRTRTHTLRRKRRHRRVVRAWKPLAFRSGRLLNPKLMNSLTYSDGFLYLKVG